jgi:HEAT repeat protein
MIQTLLDASKPLKLRAQAARLLAADGSPAAFAALRRALADAPDRLKTSIAEALGDCQNPGARGLLLELIDDASAAARVGAIRALGARGDDEAAGLLGRMLLSEDRSEEVRVEAAMALADLQQPAAFEALAMAARSSNEAVAVQAIESLGQRPFQQTQAFFEELLNSAETPRENKIAALEALGRTEGDPSKLLLSYSKNQDEELRTAAAWGILSLDEPGDLAAPLLGWLQSESNADVRSHLLHALQGQEGVKAADIVALAKSETDSTARFAAWELAASGCESTHDTELVSYFDQSVVPELSQLALSSGKAPERLASVASLGRAGTPQAIAALEDILQRTTDAQVKALAQTALKKNR